MASAIIKEAAMSDMLEVAGGKKSLPIKCLPTTQKSARH
jgi:hypothetical protein